MTELTVPTRVRREVVNYFAALRRVEKQAAKKRLTHEDVLRLHAIIAGAVMDQGESGRYRNMRARGSLTPREIWDGLAISKQGAMDLLRPLLDAGLIERAGTLKHGRYMLK